ncbi:hypothetical protein OESDEN_00059 [Oesophagostomum dentatum]|uniref:Major facilitator superfamily (MFS) profile domain-containing protein n=1 Tax=Oesophagostomum dentatum TaxID=61180 RepID=A0A0B1TV29_OESDE|nr:hypothetical protein OESDEN_00059 [Oesophagostomum dentatum]
MQGFSEQSTSFFFQKKFEDISGKARHLTMPLQLFKFSAVPAPVEKKQTMRKIGLIYFIYLFLYAGLEFTLPFLTHIRFNYTSMQQSKIYLFTGLLMLPIQGRIVRRTPMIKQKLVAEVGLMCVVPAFLIIAQATNTYILYFGLFLYAIASATVVSCLTSLVSAVHPETDKGALAGVFRSLGALARAVGPAIASTLFWLAGPTKCYTVGGILLLVPLILLRRLENPIQEKEKAS